MALIPASVASEIARIAVEVARDTAPRDTGSGAMALQPISSDGYVGISGPEYMIIQDTGFEGFDLVGLAGLTIPIRTPSGGIVFRTAAGDKIGMAGLVTRNEKGVVITKRQWYHPGLAPKNFIRNSVQEAINRWLAANTSTTVFKMLAETEYRILTDEFALGVVQVGD